MATRAQSKALCLCGKNFPSAASFVDHARFCGRVRMFNFLFLEAFKKKPDGKSIPADDGKPNSDDSQVALPAVVVESTSTSAVPMDCREGTSAADEIHRIFSNIAETAQSFMATDVSPDAKSGVESSPSIAERVSMINDQREVLCGESENLAHNSVESMVQNSLEQNNSCNSPDDAEYHIDLSQVEKFINEFLLQHQTQFDEDALPRRSDVHHSKKNDAPLLPLYDLRPVFPQCGSADDADDSLSALVSAPTAPTGRHRCPACGMRFSHGSNLIRHMRRHTSEKPYVCPECGKQFSRSEYLENHIRVHTGEKPFECPDCGKRFSKSGHLARHRRMHTGEKPYLCVECGRRFAESGSLTLHVRIHTGEKPYRCSVCGRTFSQSGNCIRHMQVHAERPPPELNTKSDFLALFDSMGMFIGESSSKAAGGREGKVDLADD